LSTYIPGSCNIGPGEIKRRQAGAVVGGLLLIAFLIIEIAHHASRTERLFAFLPALVFSTGWVQSRRKFCLAFGFMGTFNFGKLGELTKVADPADLKADRKTALSILGSALLIAAVITVLITLLPIK
jgi:hypothetical protein